MGRGVYPVSLILKALDKASAPLKKIQGPVRNLREKVKQLNNSFRGAVQGAESLQKRLSKVASGLKKVGRSMTLWVTAPALIAGGIAIKSFSDYETALVGVGKTSNLEGAELQALGKRFLQLSKTIPVANTELLGLGQTAAQLGVAGADNILNFASVLAKLSRASDVAGDEGAAALARFITVTKGSITQVKNYASALVELGNTSAATESEILHFSQRLGASTALFGFSGTQVLGVATALKSVGIEAEAGSSAIQRGLGAINKAISSGGAAKNAISKLTGIDPAELKKRFKTDAAGVLRDFSRGLNRLEKSGKDVTKILAAFGLTGVRDIAVMGALSQNAEMMDEKMKSAAKAFADNTALQKEFRAAMQPLSARFQVLVNKATVFAIKLAEDLRPALIGIMDALGGIISFLDRNPFFAKMTVAAIALAAVIGPLLTGFGFFLVMLPALKAGFAILTTLMAGFSLASLPITGTVLAIVAAIGALGVAGYFLWKKWEPVKKFFGEMWDTLKKGLSLIPGAVSSAGNDLIRGMGFGPPATGQPAPATGGRSSSDVRISFENAPRGTRIVEQKGDAPTDISLGYSMASGW